MELFTELAETKNLETFPEASQEGTGQAKWNPHHHKGESNHGLCKLWVLITHAMEGAAASSQELTGKNRSRNLSRHEFASLGQPGFL